MSNPYEPPGTPAPYRQTVELQCPNCGQTWEDTAWYEAGGMFLNEEYCPDCGEEGEVIDE